MKQNIGCYFAGAPENYKDAVGDLLSDCVLIVIRVLSKISQLQR